MRPREALMLADSGRTLHSVTRQVDSSDFGILSSLAWTTGELHTDEEYAKKTQFGTRILAGPVIYSILIGLWYRSLAPGFETRNRVRLRGPLRYQVTYRHPVLAGDAIALETTVVGTEPSLDGTATLLVLTDRGRNQRGETVVEGRRWLELEPET